MNGMAAKIPQNGRIFRYKRVWKMRTDYRLTEKQIKQAIKEFVFNKLKDTSNLKADVCIVIREDYDNNPDKIYARVEIIEEEE